ncbi:protein translocase subunit SecF [Candidatus Wolfebacteria bacterium]|nr:MAG: protein translocase subunit SecF [Candidatus Wolfebacteria bacterium]
MQIVKYRKIFFGITIALVVTAVASIMHFGLVMGIDFTGGTLLEVTYASGVRADKAVVEERLSALNLGKVSLRETEVDGAEGYILRTRDLSNREHSGVIRALAIPGGSGVREQRFNSIGPVIGQELRSKAIVAVFAVLFAIILFIAFAFRKVSKQVSSWKYGFIAIIALAHDIIVPAGVYAGYASVTGAEIDILFVMAILAILGYSVNDTIVIFDRVRENLIYNQEHNKREEFRDVVGQSLSQTYARSINTSLTTLAVLLALFFMGGSATTSFAFLLTAGVIAGTYSSLFLAAPLLVALGGKKDNH